MKVRCLKCEKMYDIDRSRYPDKGGHVACKVCDGVVKIPRLEPSKVHQEQSQAIICPSCARQCCVPVDKTSDSEDSVLCKACGADIPLLDEAAFLDLEAFALFCDPPEQVPLYESEPALEEGPGIWESRKPWFLGGAFVFALVLIVSLCMTWMGRHSKKPAGDVAEIPHTQGPPTGIAGTAFRDISLAESNVLTGSGISAYSSSDDTNELAPGSPQKAPEALSSSQDTVLAKNPLDTPAEAEAKEQVIEALESVFEIRMKRGRLYGEDLAGLYYLPNLAFQPMHLLDQAIVESDPKGQGRFGYTLKPFHGYYFTVLPREALTPTKTRDLLRSSGLRLTYKKKRWVALPVRHLVDVVALPAEGEGIAYVMTRQGLFQRPVTELFEVLPDDLEGWIPVE